VIQPEKIIYDYSAPGKRGYELPRLDVPAVDPIKVLPRTMQRSKKARLPEVSEVEVVRHFTRLSRLNYGVDIGFYPLGSCTMKYNPKINEDLARLGPFINTHPLAEEKATQGLIRLYYQLGEALLKIVGMSAITLQPTAGANGEMVGMLIVRAYHKDKGNKRSVVLIPDSSHGTNPASATLAGYTIQEVASDERGRIDLNALRKAITPEVAAMMVTNPNTLGLFEEQMPQVAELLHEIDALLYYDGANANAIMGRTTPDAMGCDIVHLNLHKTFSTPHGGGGPGAGPVAVTEKLAPYLPVPVAVKAEGGYSFDYDRPKSIGRVQAWQGNFLVLVKALVYILTMGEEGLRQVSEDAVLNANYLRHLLKETYYFKYDYPCMHEFVASSRVLTAETGVRTLDVAKRLMDFGFHPPTVYFPLIVEEALMVEPTETEDKATLEAFANALKQIYQEAKTSPDKVKGAPYTTPVGRLDEVKAVKELDLRHKFTDA
jgi:glycine dehydrogenase subunit 2